MRIDVKAALRGVAGFEALWSRRTTLETDDCAIDLLSVEDLVRAKKTQQDKDWPMIRRLVEQSYFAHAEPASAALVEFWLRELRTPELLAIVAAAHLKPASEIARERPAVLAALEGDSREIERALDAEAAEERRKDREYWEPLKRELEQLRRASPRESDR